MRLQSRRLRREFSDALHRQDKFESLIYVDDRALTRDCVAGQLAEWLPEYSVAAVSTYRDIDEPPCGERDRSVLLNTHALRVEEVEFLRNLPAMQLEAPRMRVAVLSDLETRENVVAALRRGVSGYLLTSLSLRIAAEVIRLVHAGGTFVPPSVVLGHELPGSSERDSMIISRDLGGFTPRQVEVIRWLREGKQNKAIAFELNMSESTVKVHLHHIMQKLQATNRMQVILRTRQLFEEHQLLAAPEGATDVQSTAKDAAAAWPMDFAARAGEATF